MTGKYMTERKLAQNVDGSIDSEHAGDRWCECSNPEIEACAVNTIHLKLHIRLFCIYDDGNFFFCPIMCLHPASCLSFTCMSQYFGVDPGNTHRSWKGQDNSAQFTMFILVDTGIVQHVKKHNKLKWGLKCETRRLSVIILESSHQQALRHRWLLLHTTFKGH